MRKKMREKVGFGSIARQPLADGLDYARARTTSGGFFHRRWSLL